MTPRARMKETAFNQADAGSPTAVSAQRSPAHAHRHPLPRVHTHTAARCRTHSCTVAIATAFLALHALAAAPAHQQQRTKHADAQADVSPHGRASMLKSDFSTSVPERPTATCDPDTIMKRARVLVPQKRIQPLLEAVAPCEKARNYPAVARIRAEVVRIRRLDAGKPSFRALDAAKDTHELALTLLRAKQYGTAVRTLADEVELLKDAPASEVIAALKTQAEAMNCAGNASEAVRTLNSALKMQRATKEGVMPDDMLLLLRFLMRDQATAERSSRQMSIEMRKSLQAQIGLLKKQLIRQGGWRNPEQIPQYFVTDLPVHPWYNVTDAPEFVDLAHELRRGGPQLRAEFSSLKAAGRLINHTDCILEDSRGQWAYFPVPLDAEKCQPYAHASCEFMQNTRKIVASARFHRAGYQVLGAGMHLLPHHGLSNAHLKMHIGLSVPRATDGSPCAKIRVGNETRPWKTGTVVVFDDSFEHEAWNECADDLVLFQVVIEHPDISLKKLPHPYRSVLAKLQETH